MAIALIAGYVDAYGLRVFATYVSYMSGNTTQTGSLIGQGDLRAALPSALAIIFFLIGSFAGTWLGHGGLRHARRLLFGVVAALLALVLALSGTGSLNAEVGIATLSLGMGMVNTTLSRVGSEPISLTFVTGTLNKIATHLALAARRERLPNPQGPGDSHLRRAGFLAAIWTGFLTGAILSAAAAGYFGAWVLLPAFLSLVILALFSTEPLPVHPDPAVSPASGT
jgi:uncharacterized membrane protein YoaK (UPF0700 family)